MLKLWIRTKAQLTLTKNRHFRGKLSFYHVLGLKDKEKHSLAVDKVDTVARIKKFVPPALPDGYNK